MAKTMVCRFFGDFSCLMCFTGLSCKIQRCIASRRKRYVCRLITWHDISIRTTTSPPKLSTCVCSALSNLQVYIENSLSLSFILHASCFSSSSLCSLFSLFSMSVLICLWVFAYVCFSCLLFLEDYTNRTHSFDVYSADFVFSMVASSENEKEGKHIIIPNFFLVFFVPSSLVFFLFFLLPLFTFSLFRLDSRNWSSYCDKSH